MVHFLWTYLFTYWKHAHLCQQRAVSGQPAGPGQTGIDHAHDCPDMRHARTDAVKNMIYGWDAHEAIYAAESTHFLHGACLLILAASTLLRAGRCLGG